jgi:predicted Zn-dependent protease
MGAFLRLRRFASLCACFVVVLLAGVPESRADVPVNGRHQELDFSGARVRAMAAIAYAERIDGLRRQHKLDRNATLLKRVRRIAGTLVAQAVLLQPEAAHWAWEVHVADSSGFDAFCMAGGKILISTPFVQSQQLSDGELAALLAHEIAHAIAEHVREQLTAVRKLDPAYADLSPQDVVSVIGWDLSVSLKLAQLSRLQELEADDIGIHIAAKAGFDPRELVQLYRKLSHAAQGEFLINTHLAVDGRMRAIENFAAYAELVYRENASPEHTRHNFVIR